jgi:hypothetical protein
MSIVKQMQKKPSKTFLFMIKIVKTKIFSLYKNPFFWYNFCMYLLLGMYLVSSISVPVLANDPYCSFKKSVGLGDLFRPTYFIPIISEECAIGADGKPNPLSLARAGDLAVNVIGLLSSIVFFFFGFNLLFAGVMYVYSGIDQNKTAMSRKTIRNSLFAMFIILSVFTITNWILGIFGLTNGISFDSVFGRVQN